VPREPTNAFDLKSGRDLADIVQGSEGAGAGRDEPLELWWEQGEKRFGDAAHVQAVVTDADAGLAICSRLRPTIFMTHKFAQRGEQYVPFSWRRHILDTTKV
jgi:hypothetical protein